jgi:UDP-N-acetylmuramate dehydrogenase
LKPFVYAKLRLHYQKKQKDDIVITLQCQFLLMPNKYDKFIKKFPAAKKNKPLATLTSFRIGGPADLFYELKNTEELPEILSEAQKLKIPAIILGGGSNTIFSDKGFRGLIIQIKASEIKKDGNIIIADAGALLSQVIQFAQKQNLSGMEKMTGIPGTIGGAIRGNAGAYGTEIKDILTKALVYGPKKGLREESKEYFKFGYRHSIIKKTNEIVLKAYLHLKSEDPEKIKMLQEESLYIIKNRISKQPKGFTSGSFFKNPGKNLSAGYLLEKAGCKGLQVGDAQVSKDHANWLINRGNATLKDVLELTNMMKSRVKNKFDIDLRREVQLISETGFITD